MLLLILFPFLSYAQIDIELDGGLQLGETTSEETGTIRWNQNNQDFEGWNGSQWVSFTQGNTDTPNIGNDTTNILPICVDTVISDVIDANSKIGSKVAIHDNTILVTGIRPSGRYMQFYSFGQSTWKLDTSLLLTGNFGDFNSSIILEDNLAIVGYENVNGGVVEILVNENGKWARDTTLSEIGTNAFGSDIAYNGQFLVVGDGSAEVNGINLAGKIFIYQQMNNGWSLHASYENPNHGDTQLFGERVEISDNYVFVSDNDSLYLYAITGNIITHFKTFDANIRAMSRHGSFLTIGYPRREDGEVYIFDINNLAFTDTLSIDDGRGEFGAALSLSGNYLLVTDLPSVFQNPSNTDLIIIYKYDGNEWNEINRISDPVGMSRDFFGQAIMLHGSNYVIGASSTNVNGNMDQGKFFIGSIK